jgi:hypothetical protein
MPSSLSGCSRDLQVLLCRHPSASVPLLSSLRCKRTPSSSSSVAPFIPSQPFVLPRSQVRLLLHHGQRRPLRCQRRHWRGRVPEHHAPADPPIHPGIDPPPRPPEHPPTLPLYSLAPVLFSPSLSAFGRVSKHPLSPDQGERGRSHEHRPVLSAGVWPLPVNLRAGTTSQDFSPNSPPKKSPKSRLPSWFARVRRDPIRLADSSDCRQTMFPKFVTDTDGGEPDGSDRPVGFGWLKAWFRVERPEALMDAASK